MILTIFTTIASVKFQNILTTPKGTEPMDQSLPTPPGPLAPGSHHCTLCPHRSARFGRFLQAGPSTAWAPVPGPSHSVYF